MLLFPFLGDSTVTKGQVHCGEDDITVDPEFVENLKEIVELGLDQVRLY